MICLSSAGSPARSQVESFAFLSRADPDPLGRSPRARQPSSDLVRGRSAERANHRTRGEPTCLSLTTRLIGDAATPARRDDERDRVRSDPETDVAPGLPEAAIRVQNIDAQCVLQFTLLLAASCVLHRRSSRVIHR